MVSVYSRSQQLPGFRLSRSRWRSSWVGSSVREYVFFVFFRFQKNMTFYVFFEMTYLKVVKSHQQKFSPQYVTKERSLRSMITVIRFLAPKSHCAYDFIHNRKRNRLTEARARDLAYTSIQTSNCCRSCSLWITRKQTSSGNVGQCQILTAVKRNNKH